MTNQTFILIPIPILQERFYFTRSSLSSCIELLSASGNSFKLKPQYISMLPKLFGCNPKHDYILSKTLERDDLVKPLYALLSLCSKALVDTRSKFQILLLTHIQ